ncbi:MAG: HD domain-containing protein [Firmicutes bacterium]|nr:HD domain-containing protein [Bacillota bacterium]
MKRVNRILADDDYRLYLHRNKTAEEQRSFCRHDLEHLLTVARLTYLLLLEKECRHLSREIAYSAGLLHDIGRWKEYRGEGDHAAHSAALAGPILERAGFTPPERELIVKAIAQHRRSVPGEHRSPLSEALYRADELSRLCFACDTRKECRRLEQRPHWRELQY